MSGCIVADNTALGSGGGVGGGPSGIGSTGAGGGGGLFSRGTADLTSCTIGGNTASYGGGLFDYGQATLLACTVSGNVVPKTTAAGIFVYAYQGPSSTLTLTDAIVAGNTTSDFATFGFDAGITITGSNSLTGTDGGLYFQNGVDGNIIISHLSGLDLAPLGNYGGPTESMALLPGSVAIGARVTQPGVTTDQRGEPLDSPAPDIGAYQTQGFTIAPVADSTPQAVAVGDPFANPLAVTVTANEPNQPVAGGSVTYSVNPASNGASANLSTRRRPSETMEPPRSTPRPTRRAAVIPSPRRSPPALPPISACTIRRSRRSPA